MSADSISKQVLEKFWAKKDLISSRIKIKGQHYAMEGYSQNFQKLKFSSGILAV